MMQHIILQLGVYFFATAAIAKLYATGHNAVAIGFTILLLGAFTSFMNKLVKEVEALRECNCDYEIIDSHKVGTDTNCLVQCRKCGDVDVWQVDGLWSSKVIERLNDKRDLAKPKNK